MDVCHVKNKPCNLLTEEDKKYLEKIGEGLKEVTLIKLGKIKTKTWDELYKELTGDKYYESNGR